MQQSLLQKLNLAIERFLSYPGCDQKTLIMNKNLWITCVVGLIYTTLLGVISYLINPGYKILISYGLALIATMLFFLIAGFFFKRSIKLLAFINQSLFILVTFIFILKLGGIPFSGGLVFVSLTSVFFIIAFQKISYIIWMFSLYVLSVILAGILQPYLTLFPELNLKTNVTLFVINILMMSGMILVFIINVISQNVKIEQLETLRLKELDEAKTKLFTNITHEFRTPLTVIQGMADLIEKYPEEWQKEGIAKIKKNSNILLNLVNQMLDLAKIETGMMYTHIVQTDINSYIGYVTDLFRSVADSLSVRLSYQTSESPLLMDFDPDKLLHILSNLLSNALKFTPEGGTVTVSTFTNEATQLFTIRIADTGIGINRVHLPHIFDRFYQIENGTINPNGSGLGLALAKELTELLGGNISVESKAGEGASFTVELPVRHDAPTENNCGIDKSQEQITALPTIRNKMNEVIGQKIHDGNTLPLLLIVEDSRDVSRYLEAILKNEYQIENAENGKTGLEKAMSLIPDIILSDVMMPEMDGISLLEKVKNDIRTSHIPVVMLTAKADVASRLSGLDRGADAYLAKPFEEKELHIVLKNLVEIRKKLYERYSSPEDFPLLPDPGFRMEDEFMRKVKQVLEKNLDDDEFGIAQLCNEIAVSRTQLYRKFKSVSNKTITEYFKSLRLHKAKTLLSTTNMNVTEITFATGFKNLSYFSREFSAEFGTSPYDFRRKTLLERSAKK